MSELRFPRTLARLEYELHEDEFTRGVQMTVDVAGERLLDLALGDDGTGAALESSTVFRVYCTIKPILALAIARLVEDGRIDLDAPLEASGTHARATAGGVTARHLLTHTAGVHLFTGVETEMLTPEGRRARIEGLARPTLWRLGQQAGYSEAAAWHLLGWRLEEVTGDDLRAHLRSQVLDPLGMSSTWIGMTPDEYHETLPRIGLNIDVRKRAGYPMLYERSERVCCTTNAAFGGYSTSGDLAHCYSVLLRQLEDQRVLSLPSPSMLAAVVSPARPVMHDEVLDRPCTFGLGFMTALEQHAFGADLSRASFGHSGYAGASFAFADPAHDLAVGVIFNGVVGHESAFLRRRALMRALYADRAEATADAGSAPRQA